MSFSEEYRNLRVLGEGAFASILKVKHKKLGYVRALKLSKSIVQSEDDAAYQTFLKECGVLLKLGNGCHPNIVRIYQPRFIENRAMVEMDYVEGCTLNEYLKQNDGFVDYDEWLCFVEQIVGALAYCHVDIYRFLMDASEDNLQRDPDDAKKFLITPDKEKELIEKYGITHNDLHSNNIMRRNYDGAFVLLDFGLAIQHGNAVKSSSRRDGAMEYRAPEKWDNNAAINPRSDIYSLGVLLYEVLAGRVPFVYDPSKYTSDIAVLNAMRKAHCEEAVPPLEGFRQEAFERKHPGQPYVKDYPEWVERVIGKCLAKNPADRYANASELMNDIERERRVVWQKEVEKLDDAGTPHMEMTLKNMRVRLRALNEENERLRVEIENLKKGISGSELQDEVFSVGSVRFTMKAVSGGVFQMGGTSEHRGVSFADESPSHEVFVGGFHIGETPVTQALWQAVMGVNPSHFAASPEHPVESVSWHDCERFIAKLNSLTGRQFRFPTEAEWEYAARGGRNTRGCKYAGSHDMGEVGWCSPDSNGTTHAVKRKAANELGLHDMSGNVWEWCEDWYGEDFYRTSERVNPVNRRPSSCRVCRGGSWHCKPSGCRVSYRASVSPGEGSAVRGLRLAL